MIRLHVELALAAYLHGELSRGERESVERHLALCARCRSAVVRLRAVDAALPQLPVCPAPDTLWQRIETQLDTAQHGASVEAVRDLDRALLRPPRSNRRFAFALGSLALLIAGGFATMAVLHQRAPAWEVRTLQGRPRIGWFAFGKRGSLRVGDSLTTDRGSLAEIAVADIGTVKLAPGSRVRLAATGSAQHRLVLEKGALEAKVTARPRLFVVDTQVGRAVDLGCAYRLETDGSQSTLLRVTLGEVALEDGGRSSLVPRGFYCESRRSGGLGTPIHDGASEPFRRAMRRFDYESGGDAAVDAARAAAHPPDAITLWHLLRRGSASERGPLFDTMAGMTRPPKSVTRAGVVSGDTKMLEDWKEAILYDLAESELGQ